MPVAPITLQETAELIAKLERRPNARGVLRQLKALYAAEQIKPVPGLTGKRGALMYDLAELSKARICIAATDARMDSTALVEAFEKREFKHAVAGLTKGENWFLEIRMMRDGDALSPQFRWCRWTDSGVNRGILEQDAMDPETFFNVMPGREDSDDYVDGLESEIRIKFFNLMRPIFKAMAAKAESQGKD